jgi:hypothetical protein
MSACRCVTPIRAGSKVNSAIDGLLIALRLIRHNQDALLAHGPDF